MFGGQEQTMLSTSMKHEQPSKKWDRPSQSSLHDHSSSSYPDVALGRPAVVDPKFDFLLNTQ